MNLVKSWLSSPCFNDVVLTCCGRLWSLLWSLLALD